MTTTLQVQAQQTIADSVLKNTHLLIEALKDNYRDYAIRGHQRTIAIHGTQVEYHQQRIDELKAGDCSIDYTIETGKKYHKVVFIDGGGSRSVHAFIDKQTGEVYKSASWKAPAKGVRYDLRLIADREYLLQNADWSGSYLYAK
jgi:oxalate decarboxylase/phosphoglucose isomerase-like protein (cupin superfamily)